MQIRQDADVTGKITGWTALTVDTPLSQHLKPKLMKLLHNVTHVI